MRALAPLAALLAACGLGAAAGGGDEQLPTAGAGPYGKPDFDAETPAEEPYVVVENGVALTDPTARRNPDGSFDLWFTRTAGGGAPEIWHARLADVTERPDPAPALALAASEAWEAGAVERPALATLPDGSLALYYQGGGATPAIGLALSADEGVTWQKQGMVLTAGATDPAALALDDRVLLYVGLPGGRIGVAESADGRSFGDAAVVLEPSLDLAKFDSVWVGEPAVVGGLTPAGQLRIGLFYVGRDTGGSHAIGHAASPDGRSFSRFFNGDAVLEPGGADERGPTAVLAADRGWLFYGERRVAASAIGVALHP